MAPTSREAGLLQALAKEKMLQRGLLENAYINKA
jgi:hypothetical protein